MSRMAVIYWSMSGNTESMAKAIAEGATEAGAEVSLFEVTSISAKDALTYDLLALGCPSMGDEVLEEADFEPFFEELEKDLAGKKVAIFGSYGWGDGKWMRDWQTRVREARAELFSFEGLIIHETPDDGGIARCKKFGGDFAKY